MVVPTEEDGFSIKTHVDYPGWRLFTPRKDKWKWNPEEYWFRSTILNEKDEIVSSGFPKFFNYGENEASTSWLEQQARNDGLVLWTEKIDGVCVIRTWLEDQQRFMWRTRGTFDGGDFRPAIDECVAKHPRLVLPEFALETMSLIFEMQHPIHRIVESVSEPRLILIGAVYHQNPKLLEYYWLKSLSEILHVPITPTYTWSGQSLETIVEEVRGWRSGEGVVARCLAEQIYVKLKAEEYLRLHALRFSMTPRKIWETCRDYNLTFLHVFEEYFMSMGLDYETVQTLIPEWERYMKCYRSAGSELFELCFFIDAKGWIAKEDRKAFAAEVMSRFQNNSLLKSAAFLHVDKGCDDAWKRILYVRMEEALKNL